MLILYVGLRRSAGQSCVPPELSLATIGSVSTKQKECTRTYVSEVLLVLLYEIPEVIDTSFI